MKPLKYLLLATILSACGGKYTDPTPQGVESLFNSQKITVLQNSNSLTVTNSSINGTGAVVFDTRFEQFQSGGSYAMDFALEDSGSLTLISHADENLNSGFEIKFQRQGSGPGSLLVNTTAQGTTKNANTFFATLDASQALKFQLDIHNNETPTHILVWNRALEENFAEEVAILNSEENDVSPGIGTNIRWGVKLQNASLTKADRSAPKFEE